MARRLAWMLLVALAASPATTYAQEGRGQHQNRSGREQDPNRWKWWINADDRRELGITDAQSAQIEEIFAATAPRQRQAWHEFERAETALSQIIKEGTADIATVTQHVERVEKLRAAVNTIRAVMLYRINLVLTPEQRVKLEAFRSRRDENRRRQPGKSDKSHKSQGGIS